MGFSLAGIGDLNGDSVPDLAVGAPGNGDRPSDEEAGVIWLFSLRRDGGVLDVTRLSKTYAPLVFAMGSDSLLGLVVGRAGDVDGDGVPDLLVGPFEPDGAEVHGVLLHRSGEIKEQFRVAVDAPVSLG